MHQFSHVHKLLYTSPSGGHKHRKGGALNNAWNKLLICINVNKFHFICSHVRGALLHLKYALDPSVLSLMWSWIPICNTPGHTQHSTRRGVVLQKLALFHLVYVKWIVPAICSRPLSLCCVLFPSHRRLISKEDKRNGGKTLLFAFTATAS